MKTYFKPQTDVTSHTMCVSVLLGSPKGTPETSELPVNPQTPGDPADGLV